MTVKDGVNLLFIFLVLAFSTSACHMGDSSQMSQSDQQEIQSTYESLQKSYQKMIEAYQRDSVTMSQEVKGLYDQMHQMYEHMDENHQHMVASQRRAMHDDEQDMMRGKMRRQFQNRMTSEWYNQMKSMHQQMAQEHRQRGDSEIAKQHRQQGQHFQQLLDMMPAPEQLDEELVNEQGNPDILNGANLYAQNCASCHGSNGQGVGNAFPPLVDTDWVTGDKSIPVRIIRDGLSGEIEVDGKTYNGSMPSFKARLSLAEIAAIVNYLREIGDGDHPSITQDDVIKISNSYADRDNPWKAEDILGN